MTRPRNELEALRAQDLLAQRATDGLDAAAAAELERLGADEDLSFELAAAAVDLATLPYQELPASVAAKVLATAPGAARAIVPTVPMTAPAVPAVAADLPQPIGRVRARATTRPVRPGWRVATVTGWSVAAAATLVAAGAWLVGPRSTPANGDRQAAPIVEAPDAISMAWTADDVRAGGAAAGELVWSESRQRGVARFSALPPNDPARERYQLWIFDAARDVRYPVHGALFDAAAVGPTVVAVEPQMPIDRAVRFLVTLEPPDGVVVSRRDRVVLSAEVIRTGP